MISEVDYFLQYIADIPADEIELHEPFNRSCQCKPEVTFDDLNGWHYIEHRSIKKS